LTAFGTTSLHQIEESRTLKVTPKFYFNVCSDTNHRQIAYSVYVRADGLFRLSGHKQERPAERCDICWVAVSISPAAENGCLHEIVSCPFPGRWPVDL